jgi:hypothetical protein
MKYFLLVKLLLLPFCLSAQSSGHMHDVKPTEQFTVEGDIRKTLVFNLSDAGSFKTFAHDSVVIYNHLHQRKSVIKNIRGILLKDVLDRAEINVTSPKLLSEYYIICIASDDYKVVFSWNEIFNSDAGKHILVITEADSKKAADMPERIAILSPTDHATGRRFVQGLTKIVIERVK